MLLDCSTVLQNQSVQPELRLCYWLHASLTSITETMMIKHIHYIESTLIWETAGDLFIDKCVHETKNVFSSIFFSSRPHVIDQSFASPFLSLGTRFPLIHRFTPKKQKSRSLKLDSSTYLDKHCVVELTHELIAVNLMPDIITNNRQGF